MRRDGRLDVAAEDPLVYLLLLRCAVSADRAMAADRARA
jgi:hypothetical protein